MQVYRNHRGIAINHLHFIALYLKHTFIKLNILFNSNMDCLDFNINDIICLLFIKIVGIVGKKKTLKPEHICRHLPRTLNDTINMRRFYKTQ